MKEQKTIESGIYKLICLITGKFYIGQAIKLNRRLYDHKRGMHNQRLKNAIKKYGWGNFAFQILEFIPAEKLDEREQYYLDLLTPWDKKIGYNIAKLAISRVNENNGMFGKKHSELTKQKIREKAIGRTNPMTGQKHSIEARERMKQSHTKRDKTKLLELNKSKRRAVNQINLITEKVIKTWESIQAAEKALNLGNSKISRMIHNTPYYKYGRPYYVKQVGGFKWELA